MGRVRSARATSRGCTRTVCGPRWSTRRDEASMKFKGARDGSVVVTLDGGELQLLRDVPEQLRALYESPDPDPARERLFPRAYLDPTEEAAEEQWSALMHPELLRQRLAGLDALLRTL